MNFIATIEDSADMDKVVDYLLKKGFTIDRVRPFSRNISGKTNKKTLKDLLLVKGIKFAEEERNIYNA